MLFIIYHERQNRNEADPKPVLCNNMSKFDFAARTTTANGNYYNDIVVSVREIFFLKIKIFAFVRTPVSSVSGNVISPIVCQITESSFIAGFLLSSIPSFGHTWYMV